VNVYDMVVQKDETIARLQRELADAMAALRQIAESYEWSATECRRRALEAAK
jgi:hypothetical protein